MDRALLDTDILSEILKGKNPRVVANADAYRATFGHYLISTISVIEIVKGFHKRGREEDIRQFLTLPHIQLTDSGSRSLGTGGTH